MRSVQRHSSSVTSTIGTGEEVHIGEAARRLGVSARYLRMLEAEGRIPPARRGFHGRGVYGRVYTEDDLAMLRALGVGSKPDKLRTVQEVLDGSR